MKKIKAMLVVFAVTVLAFVMSLSASAAQTATPEEYFSYSIVNKSVIIKNCKATDLETIVIPESISGYPVVEIGDGAFRSCMRLKDVTLPKNLRKIGSYAFDRKLEAVRISDLESWLRVDFIDGRANPMYEAKNVYLGDELLTDVVIPEGVTELKDFVFIGGESIKSIKLPSTLKTIGKYSVHGNVYVPSIEFWVDLFKNSYENYSMLWDFGTNLYVDGELLVDLAIPETVTELPRGVFEWFKSIKSVTFHKNFSKVDPYTFNFCINLNEVYVPDLATWLRVCNDMNLLNNFDTIYIDNEPVINLVVPDDVDKIPCKAFYNYEKLESVSFSSPGVEFESGWVTNCPNMKTLYVDSYDTWMNCKPDQFYAMLENIECLYIDNVPVIDYVIPEGETKIADFAFRGYKGIRSITIPKGIEYIGEGAFSESGLKNVYVDSMESWFEICRKTAILDDYWGTTGIPTIYAENFYIGGVIPVDVVIPENITYIPDLAFYGVKSIRSITLHEGITDISSHAFSGCTNVKEVYVPDFSAWSKMCNLSAYTKLEAIYIDNEPVVDFVVPEGTVSLPANCFKNYAKLESITIGKGLKSIGADCFTGCSNLKDVYVDSLSTWINLNFADDTANPMNVAENLYIAGRNTEDLVIDENMTSIPANAFADCTQIKSVTLHENITSIGENAFSGCTNLESVYAPSIESWLNIDFASGSANPLSNGAKLYIDGVLLENLRVPENISKIKQYAFSGYGYLKTFEITGAPLEIGMSAFTNACKDMEIHAKTLKDWLNVSVDASLSPDYCNPMRYGATLYVGGKQPVEIVIPESVKRIPDFAFQNCKSLKKVTIPATTALGDDSFIDCSLDELIIGNLTKKVEPVLDIPFSSFDQCKIGKLIIGYGVKSIGNAAFKGKKTLKEVVMYSGLEKIGNNAFRNSGITAVTIPSTVKEVGNYAFAYCEALESLTLGDEVGKASVMNIGASVFENCPKLTKVTFNSGVKKVGEFAFDNSFAIKDIYVNDLVSYLGIRFYGYSYEGQYSSPTRFAENIYINGKIVKNLVIPEGVTYIANYAFYNFKSIETVKFPSTLKEIGEVAFSNCTNLKNFELPESVETIEDSAFFCCSSLTTIKFGKNLKYIGMRAFDCCKNIKVVYMYPEQINLGKYAFRECNNIELILYTGTKEAWNKLLKANQNTGLEGVAVYYGFRPESMYAPAQMNSTPATDSITLAWSPVTGVTGYRLFVRLDGKWKTVKTLKGTTYKVTGVTPGTKYTFAVKAYISSGAFVLWAPEYITHDTATKAVRPSKVTATQNTGAIKLNWTASPGATGYRIFYKSGNNWKVMLSSTTATTHTFKNLNAGEKFTFAIQPYIINGSSIVWGQYAEFTTATKPATVTAKASSGSSGKISLSWNQVSGSEGYQIWYKKGDGSFKLYKTVGAGTKSMSFSNLNSGTKYTFAVRAGKRTSGGNIFGGYKTATVTVK